MEGLRQTCEYHLLQVISDTEAVVTDRQMDIRTPRQLQSHTTYSQWTWYKKWIGLIMSCVRVVFCGFWNTTGVYSARGVFSESGTSQLVGDSSSAERETWDIWE